MMTILLMLSVLYVLSLVLKAECEKAEEDIRINKCETNDKCETNNRCETNNKPENFTDLLNLQKELDKKIINYRPRKLKDIKKSLIAECIEFDEETIDSHKTWKTNKRYKEKELEELTDIWFFVAQLINYAYDIGDVSITEVRNLDVFFKTEDYTYFGDTDVLTIINDIRTPRFTYEFLRELVRDLKCLSLNYGYKHNDILDCYWNKWNKNINRINSEWN